MSGDIPRRAPEPWEHRPADPHPTTWEIDPDEGVVQGPLDLAFLAGRRLDLILPEGMVALLAVRGELRLCFLDGIHHLNVGHETGDLPADGLLYFFDLAGEIDLAWRQHLALRPSESGEGARPAGGRFRVRIVNASAFHEAFLCEKPGAGEDICRDALSHLLPTFLAIHLARTAPERLDDRTLQEQIADLDPASLDPMLGPYGLACLGVEAALDGASLPVATAPC